MRFLLIALFLMGCATPFEHRTTLPAMDVIISDDCSGHRGLAWADSAEICIEGYLENDGTITVNQEVLGHEVVHVLHHFDKTIRHPHRSKECQF